MNRDRHAALRREKNAELLERMKDPDDRLQAYDARETFFPVRPKIKKDLREIQRVLGQGEGE